MAAIVSKLAVLLIYAASLASLFIAMPVGLATSLQIISLLLLVTHTLECVVCWRYLKLYQGPLAMSIVYTLLFGFVHWLPLKKQAQAQSSA